ncbi:MAG TPA: matrixin family metalloprotease [Vicinamibacterales bacterium]|nr:matrixin family metalloprotease [Vicinamibacterales bacterium]
MKRLVALLLALVQPQPAFAYLHFGQTVNGKTVTVKWAQTPRYYVNAQSALPGVTPADFESTIAKAFATWEAVPTATIAYQFAGVTSAQPGDDDGLSVLGFRARPDLDRVLASTDFVLDDATGEVIESDIFFNASFAWSVAPNGESGKYDLQSIATHEIGHFGGLGHSALGETELRDGGGRVVISAEAVMFPIAFTAGSIAARTLKADDIAGITDLYPTADAAGLGSLSGRVAKAGQPLFGAHVVAIDVATGQMVGGFALTAQGEFSIGGLSPGPHIVRVEPLDDADLDSFFSSSATVDLNFRVAFLDRLVVVPRGGDTGAVAIGVVPK